MPVLQVLSPITRIIAVRLEKEVLSKTWRTFQYVFWSISMDTKEQNIMDLVSDLTDAVKQCIPIKQED